MNGRKIIFWCGVVALLLIAGVVGISLLMINRSEAEKNVMRTNAARRARWSREGKTAPQGTEEAEVINDDKTTASNGQSHEPELDAVGDQGSAQGDPGRS